MTSPSGYTPWLDDGDVSVLHGDCIEVMRELDADSVDAVICDPPYGLEFMGKDWDRLSDDAVARSWDTRGRTMTDAPVRDEATPGGRSGASVHRKDNPRCDNCGRAVNGRATAKGFKVCECPVPAPRLPSTSAKKMQAWHEAWAREAFRVLKPGGHLAAFGGTRTSHRLASGIEDAGFEIRDTLAWLYGSGFPKSLDVSKAIDKMDATAERDARAKRSQTWLREHVTPKQVDDATGTRMGHHLTTHPTQPFVPTPAMLDALRPMLPDVPAWLEELVTDRAVESANMAAREVTGERAGSTMPGFAKIANGEPTTWSETLPHTADAEAWQGWGTALKPAHEPITLARKPLRGTVAANVLAFGTGALNIDATRIEHVTVEGGTLAQNTHLRDGVKRGANTAASSYDVRHEGEIVATHAAGRWPANVILDAEAAALLDQQTGETSYNAPATWKSSGIGGYRGVGEHGPGDVRSGFGDRGGASRFFYTAKASSGERNDGLHDLPAQRSGKLEDDAYEWPTDGKGNPRAGRTRAANTHPTVKPVDLMRWLIRLLVPEGALILDPFAGSGTTGVAARLESVRCVLIEREAEYLPIIAGRLSQQSLL